MQLQVHYITQHYATLRKLHYTTNTTATALLYTGLHYTFQSTVHNTTVPYTTLITPHHSCNRNCNRNCNYTTLIISHDNYKSTTLQLQL